MFPPQWPLPGSGQSKVLREYESQRAMKQQTQNSKINVWQAWLSESTHLCYSLTDYTSNRFHMVPLHLSKGGLTCDTWQDRHRITHPACSLKHFEVQWVSRQLALYFGKRVAGGHASHKLGLDKVLLVGIFLWQVETGQAGEDKFHSDKYYLLIVCEICTSTMRIKMVPEQWTLMSRFSTGDLSSENMYSIC